jgi:alpha-galactosidase
MLAALSVAGASIAGCSAPTDAGSSQRLTPPMGWNSWNSGIPLTEDTVKATVDATVSSGMRDAGYRYVNLDAGWAAATRGSDGKLRADPKTFPHGITALARYIHDRGMLLGLYASPTTRVAARIHGSPARVTRTSTRGRSPRGASTI